MQNNHPPSFENLCDTIVRRVAQVFDIDASAERFKAFRRPRGIKSAEDLLRLAFIYGPGGLSLRMTSGIAEAAKIASLSDVALLILQWHILNSSNFAFGVTSTSNCLMPAPPF